MTLSPPALAQDDWRRLRDALRYQGRDLHHRSYAVTPQRRELLWEEMDRCLELADRIEAHLEQLGASGISPAYETSGD